MKSHILMNGKRYIILTIALVMVLSIGLSFCVWDNNSIANSINSGTSHFGDKYALGIDGNNNNQADIGDTIYFGNYYQADNETDKSAIEWRIVDIRTENKQEVMYLWSEKIITVGCFYGYETYFDIDGNYNTVDGIRVDRPIYYDSTVRAWLNSESRSDKGADKGGIGFGNPPAGNRKTFNGFYNEAFSSSEKDRIISRNLEANEVSAALSNQKVWLPSYREIYGDAKLNGEAPGDSLNERQFAYYNGVSLAGDDRLKCEVNPYAKSEYSSYINTNAYNNKINYKDWTEGIADYVVDGKVRCYYLRSMGVGAKFKSVSTITYDGRYIALATYISMGIRPAICLAR